MIYKGQYSKKTNYEISYDKVFSLEFLCRAYQIARRGKRAKSEVIKFEANLGHNLCKVYQQLKLRKYTVGKYKKFTIYEPKRREIQALSFKDRVVLHTLCDNFVVPEFDKRLIYDNCACRINKGAHFGLSRLNLFLRRFYKTEGSEGYFLKCDITKYFQSINHNVLKEMLSFIKDEELKKVVVGIIDSYEFSPNTGIPMGNQTSQWFALLYLNPLDRLIKEKLGIKYYIRYMDDCIIIDKSKEKLKKILEIMRELVEKKLKLTFNKKTQIFPLKNGCEFLGFKTFLLPTGKVIRKVKKQTKKRLQNRIKFYVKQYNNGVLEYSDFKEPLRCTISHLNHGNCYGLIKNNLKKLVLLNSNRQKTSRNKRKTFIYKV